MSREHLACSLYEEGGEAKECVDRSAQQSQPNLWSATITHRLSHIASRLELLSDLNSCQKEK